MTSSNVNSCGATSLETSSFDMYAPYLKQSKEHTGARTRGNDILWVTGIAVFVNRGVLVAGLKGLNATWRSIVPGTRGKLTQKHPVG